MCCKRMAYFLLCSYSLSLEVTFGQGDFFSLLCVACPDSLCKSVLPMWDVEVRISWVLLPLTLPPCRLDPPPHSPVQKHYLLTLEYSPDTPSHTGASQCKFVFSNQFEDGIWHQKSTIHCCASMVGPWCEHALGHIWHIKTQCSISIVSSSTSTTTA